MANKLYQEKFMGKVGDVYSVAPEFLRSSVEKRGILRGKVVFIPPHRRFAVLAFQGVHGVSRETFWPEDLKARCRV